MSRVQRASKRGFTIVELMMSLAVLTVGLSGVVAMQKLTAMTNLHSKSVAIATRVAEAWQSQLLVDGTQWRRSTQLTNTVWLQSADAAATWIRPAFDTRRAFGAGFDALGNPVAEANYEQAQFCVHLQLVPVVPFTDSANATIRATIRVIWPRAQGNPGATHFCAPQAQPSVADRTEDFHSLYQTIAIRVHP
jgi:prepilin-type N-terminal cleavage/methylation domain-containing protein